MAKPGAAAAAAKAAAAVEAAAAAAAEGLKRELRRLVMAIAGDDHGAGAGAGGAGAEAFDEAGRALARLRELRLGGGNGGSKGTRRREEEGGGGHAAVPEHFLCPISSEIMRDPVVLASGQTYDRAFIQEWLNSGNRTCPQTQQVLSNTALTPNHLVRSMISQWCVDHGVDLPPLDNQDEGLVTRNDRDEFNRLLDRISPSSAVVDKRQAIRDLRLLTKRNRSFRAVIGEKPDSISQLLSALSEIKSPEAVEDIVTTILNLSIHDSNKKILGENPNVIPMLIDALYSGTMEARSNSAAALFTLSALDSNKLKIGELGAMRPLVDLLEDGTLTAKKDAASAVFNLCMAHENRARAVREGLIEVAVRSVADRTLVDELLAILALLSSDREAVEEIGEAGGIPLLLGIARENSCKRSTENAAVVLFSMCMSDRSKLKEVGEDENLNGTLAWLAQNGTSRARRKAAGILEKLKKAMNMNNTHYSC